MADKRYGLLLFFSLLVGAFAVRLLVVLFSIDIPGEGPALATRAYNWARSPYIAIHGNNLPSFMYLAGAVNVLFGNPLYSARIVNLIIGAVTIPVFYLLVHEIWGRATAIFSASVLLLLPLHIGLSASSLSEATLLFTVVTGMLFLVRALEETSRRNLRLSLAVLFFCAAAMTRYEAWFLMPLASFYYFWKTRNLRTTILIGGVLLLFPLAWMVGSYLYEGNLLPAFSSNTKSGPEAVGARAVEFFEAAAILRRKMVGHLGWILFAAVLAGATLQLTRILRRQADAARALYVSTVAVCWMFIFYFAVKRGESLWDRYLLFGLVMLLPFALAPFVRYVNRNNHGFLAIIISVAIVSAGVSGFYYHRPEIYVTRREPTVIKRIALWLRDSPYRERPIVLTKMDWKATYLPLYFPEASSRVLVVSFWTSDSRLQDFLKNRQPSLLITRDGDDEFQSRIEALLGRRIHSASLVHAQDDIKVYSLDR